MPRADRTFKLGDKVYLVPCEFSDKYSDDFNSIVQYGREAIYVVTKVSRGTDEYLQCVTELYNIAGCNDVAKAALAEFAYPLELTSLGAYDLQKAVIETAEDLENLYQ